MEEEVTETDNLDSLIVGKRIRALRNEKRMTLDTLAEILGRATSYVSGIETGKKDPKLAELNTIAKALDVELDELINSRIPAGRAALEIEFEKAQRGPLFKKLNLPELPVRKSLSDDSIKVVLGLHNELQRIHSERAATPEEARRANTDLRKKMRSKNNYFPELEKLAFELHQAIGHKGGPLSQRLSADLAMHLGFTLHYVSDLPYSTRSVTDSKNMRIYLPRNAQGDPRTILLQALAAYALGNKDVKSYEEFLQQRVEINYLAGALLIDQTSAVKFMKEAKTNRELAVEDLRDTYAVGYETAAHRFTNLATEHLGIPVHFLKAHSTGAL